MSGAKNCPETPRQRMIGMMYLVLTAMLALNVSSEVLQGFSMVDKSLHSSIESTNMRMGALYDDFEQLYQQNPTKVKEWLDKAKALQLKADSVYNYIQNFKYQIIVLADKSDADPEAIEIKAKDNLDVAGQYALVEGHGKELHQQLYEYRQLLIDLTPGDSLKQRQYETIFSLERSQNKSWEESMFEMMPLSAAVTLLTKYQSDIRTTEMDMIQYLKAQTDASDFRVNKIEALVVPESKYVIKGGKYSAKIVLAAVDSTAAPTYYINNQRINDRGLYEVNTSQTGTFKYNGQVRLPGNDGIVRSYSFTDEYIVGEPSATISNVDLNVVYRGIDNRFSISVPGVASENVSVSANGATVRKSGGNYIINPTQDDDITIVVSGKMDGKTIQMGSMKYRVRYIPDPKSYIQYRDAGGVPRTIQEGRLTKAILRSNDFKVVASYGEDELIKANFEVVSFTLATIIGQVDAQGSTLTKRQLDDINRLERNDLITFRNIKAKGPDGKIRSLPPIQIEL
ncbi:gliding motility protein GldM [Paludibacter sp. 221]|uniref:type IX secretion system motor protein PorM/GldM n=1 Tax=Paludibacter sp. 221 TaxID=2302939 RepID=UPI001D8FC505|nr:gliding motility protein GldM [Paludibacter sp. 221]NDV46347.1 gliding motility protein GldM [Paludibacter sp. 221]